MHLSCISAGSLLWYGRCAKAFVINLHNAKIHNLIVSLCKTFLELVLWKHLEILKRLCRATFPPLMVFFIPFAGFSDCDDFLSCPFGLEVFVVMVL